MSAYPRTVEALREIAHGFSNEGVTRRMRRWLAEAARDEKIGNRQIRLLVDGSWASHGGYETGMGGARRAASDALRALRQPSPEDTPDG